MARLRVWTHTEPVMFPRWMLYFLYGLFVILGVTLALSGSPSLERADPDWYLFPYGAAIAGVSGLALFGAAIKRPAALECAAAFCLFALLSLYIVSTVGPWLHGNLGRGALGVVVTITSAVPLFRSIALASTIIRKWAVR